MDTFPQTRWTLTALLAAPSGPPLDQALAEVEQRTAQFEAARSRLTSDIDAEDLLELIKQLEELNRVMRKVAAYAELWFTEDTQNQNALSLKSRVEQLAAQVSNRILFFTLWWKDVDDANAARLLHHAGDYRYWLEIERKFKPHTLSEAEEKVINIKDVNGIGGVITIYDMITNKYTFTLQVNGETKKLTYGELTGYYRHPDPQVRAAAYKE